MSSVQQILAALAAAPAGGSSYWNVSDKGALIVLSGTNNRTKSSSTGGTDWDSVRSITSHNSGKFYAEENSDNTLTSFNMFGVATSAASLTNFGGSDAFGWVIQNDSSSSYRNNGALTASGLTPPGNGERNMVAVDWDTTPGSTLIWVGSRGNWVGAGNPSTGASPLWTVASVLTLYLIGSVARNTQVSTLKNQVGENLHTVPTGFSMWG